MHFASPSTTLATLALATLVSSLSVSPKAEVRSDNEFTSLPITRGRVRSGYRALASQKLAAQGRQGTALAINEESSYIVNPTIGGKSYSLILDTGSSNTWIPLSKYQKTNSSLKTNRSFDLSYGTGDASGALYKDTFTLGGLTVEKQLIGIANQIKDFDGADGILGVGPLGLTQRTTYDGYAIPTVMNNLKTSGAIKNEILGIYFHPLSGSSDTGSNGAIDIGGVNPKRYKGGITYASITKEYPAAAYWGIDVQAVTFGQHTLLKNVQAVVDTGTTFIYIPQNGYNTWLKTTRGWTDKASGLSAFSTKPTSTLRFKIAGREFTLSPTQYLLPTDQYDNWGVKHGKFYSWISTLGTDVDVTFIIGQKFLENYYSVYDRTNHRVGLATRA